MSTQKIVKKSAVWSHHGRRRGLLGISQELNRKPRRKKPQMFASFADMWAAYRRKR